MMNTSQMGKAFSLLRICLLCDKLGEIDRPSEKIDDWMNRVGIVLLIWLFLY